MKRIKIFFKNIIKIAKRSVTLSMLPFVIAVFVVGMITVGATKTILITIGLLAILITIDLIDKKRKENKENKEKNTKSIKKEEKKKTVKTKKKRRILHTILNIILVGIILVILGIGCFIGYIVVTAPEFKPENLYKKEASIMYDAKGQVIAKLGAEIRDKISYNDMPQVLIDAILATEDARFYQHNGFDLPRFLKASLGQVLGNSGAGGASTITMQVAKNNLTSTDVTVTRKFTDIYMSIFVLEKNYSKEEILEFYVNAPFLGANSYGIAEACRNYFGKEIQDINLSEAAFLAGLFQSPAYYGDAAWTQPERIEKRRSTVLYLMRRHGFITKEEEEIANAIPIETLLIPREKSKSQYQSFIDFVVEEVKEKTGNSPNNVPMMIYTTLDPDRQNYLNDVMDGKKYTWVNDAVQAGVAITNVNTGAIVALSGGRNISVERGLNRAIGGKYGIKRQPGSTAKTIFEYAPGIEYENWSTYTPFLDDVHTYSNGKDIKNWDSKYMGLLTLKQSLGLSRNIPSLKAFQMLNNKDILNFVTSLGIKPEIENGYIHEAHSIGAFNGTSPLEMAAAYAAFANGGYYIEPYSVTKITYLDTGETKEFTPIKNKVMEDSTAYLITNVLQWSVEYGMSSSAGKVNGYEIAAKTGTTNFDQDFIQKNKLPYDAASDYWVIGYNPEYAVGLWYGYDKITKEGVEQKHYLTSADSSRKDKLFNTIIKEIVKGTKRTFDIPKSVIAVQIEKETIPGALPSEFTPSDMITTEYFKKGTEPTTVSERYKQLPNVTQLKVETNGNKINISWKPIETPTYYTEEYMTAFFNQYYKNQSEKYLQQHKNKISTEMGVIGYDVYYKDSNNTVHFLGTTTNNSIEVNKPSETGNITFIVKTAFSIFKNNASTGSEFIFKNEEMGLIPEYEATKTLTARINTNIEESELKSFIKVKDLSTGLYVPGCNVVVSKANGEILTFPINVSTPTTYNLRYTVTCNGKQVRNPDNTQILQTLIIN